MEDVNSFLSFQHNNTENSGLENIHVVEGDETTSPGWTQTRTERSRGDTFLGLI